MEATGTRVFNAAGRPWVLFFFATIVTLNFTYGGIQSPDAEVMFRTAERLAFASTFSHETDLEDWPNFGLPRGIDGHRYQWFGPGQSLLEVPLLFLARPLASAWSDHAPLLDVPPSHFFRRGLTVAYQGGVVARADLAAHLTRAIVALLSAFLAGFTVLVLSRTFEPMVGNKAMAGWCGLVVLFGTPLFNYATTLFSEPLATLGCVIAFQQAMQGDRTFHPTAETKPAQVLLSGGALSVAVAAHITAILYAPVIALYFWHNARVAASGRRGPAALSLCLFGAPFLPVIAFLAFQNRSHFGDVFETGRGVMPQFWHRGFVAPWEGLYGQILSPGKGIAFFAPLAIISLGAALLTFRRLPWIGRVLCFYVIARLLFIAGRADWHAGFCLGPRYQIMALPDYLVLGALALQLLGGTERRRQLVTILLGLAVAQQLYFASGEIFLFTHKMRDAAVAVLKSGQPANIYLDWRYSPLWGLLDLTRGPWLWRALNLNPYLGWALTGLFASSVSYLAYRGKKSLTCTA